MQWMPISEKAGAAWGVDPQLITAIIAIESARARARARAKKKKKKKKW